MQARTTLIIVATLRINPALFSYLSAANCSNDSVLAIDRSQQQGRRQLIKNRLAEFGRWLSTDSSNILPLSDARTGRRGVAFFVLRTSVAFPELR
jgi:hypothetical protein